MQLNEGTRAGQGRVREGRGEGRIFCEDEGGRLNEGMPGQGGCGEGEGQGGGRKGVNVFVFMPTPGQRLGRASTTSPSAVSDVVLASSWLTTVNTTQQRCSPASCHAPVSLLCPAANPLVDRSDSRRGPVALHLARSRPPRPLHLFFAVLPAPISALWWYLQGPRLAVFAATRARG